MPIVSGNAWRGVLRRTAETLIAPVLDYAGLLTPAAAHLLRNGGFLRKSSTELSPEDERALTRLVPVVGLFGGAANARIIGSKLVVSKVVPVTEQTRHILPCPPAPGYLAPATVHAVLRQESTSHFPDAPIAAPEAAAVLGRITPAGCLTGHPDVAHGGHTHAGVRAPYTHPSRHSADAYLPKQ